MNKVIFKHFLFTTLFSLCAVGYSTQLSASTDPVSSLTVFDSERQRHIPVKLYQPIDAYDCNIESQCKVALLSSGYGLLHTDYKFIAHVLQQQGYLVIAVRHELPDDPALSVTGNLYQTRTENWQRGGKTLEFVREYFMDNGKQQYVIADRFDFSDITLIGHSNGGDISALLSNYQTANNPYITRIITLDHRRVPLPRDKNIRVLSIRATDFPADKGVLPNKVEQKLLGHCVITVANAKHNDMSDYGPNWLKMAIEKIIHAELNAQIKQASCD